MAEDQKFIMVVISVVVYLFIAFSTTLTNAGEDIHPLMGVLWPILLVRELWKSFYKHVICEKWY